MNHVFTALTLVAVVSAIGWLAGPARAGSADDVIKHADAAFDELDGPPATVKKAAPAAPAPKKLAAPAEKAAPAKSPPPAPAATPAAKPASAAPRAAKEVEPAPSAKTPQPADTVRTCHQRVDEFLADLRKHDLTAALAQTSDTFKRSVQEGDLSKFLSYITDRSGGSYTAVDGGQRKDGTIVTVGQMPLDGSGRLIITGVHKDGKLTSLRGSL